MGREINQWEIWFGNFPYEEDNSQSKPRPIIVIDPSSCMVLSVKVTTTSRTHDDYDYPIQFWKDAGLKFCSSARVSKIIEVGRDAFIHKIGKLHDDDIYGLSVTIEAYVKHIESQEV